MNTDQNSTTHDLEQELEKERRLCDLLADRLRTVMGWVEFEDGDAAIFDYDEARS